MKYVLDTHLLLCAAAAPERLSPTAHEILANPANELYFSVASLWEIAIKSGLGGATFTVDAALLRRGLRDQGYQELPITGAHAAAVATLPRLHKDPFDRLLIAISTVEGILLLTNDSRIARYPGPIQLV